MIDGVPRIFVEYVPGGSLAEALRSGGVSTMAEIVDVAIQMAWGLSAAHQAGVVHQDVKPANVLLAEDGTAKITDFGLVRALARVEATTNGPRSADGSDRMPRTRGGLTPAYASPEQLAGQSLLDLGQAEDAESCLRQALRVDPRHSNATFNSGLIHWRAAKITDRQVVDRLETVREADVGAGVRNGRAHYLLGLVHLERGDGIAAAELLGEAARLAPDDP
jgi:serine/threonine protein kinase